MPKIEAVVSTVLNRWDTVAETQGLECSQGKRNPRKVIDKGGWKKVVIGFKVSFIVI